MSGIEVLDQLIAAARLPEVVSTEPVDEHGDGLDNLLTKATLADGREVLLRESRVQDVAPTLRAKFLEACGVGAPHLYAANDRGAMLVDFVPGRQLSEMLATDTVSDRTWELTGAAFARVHAVRFPAPLQGLVGPASVVLEPVDPVDQLMAALEGARPWLAQHQSQVLPVVDQLRSFIVRRADNIRAEVPCLIHGDANLLNIIVEKQVTLIDWDFPAVRYPLAELSALDEHVYLTGGVGLPPAFFAGYGHAVPADLLLAYRMVGCLRWLSSAEWKRWEVDRAMPASARRRLGRWHERLLEWVGGIPALAQDLQC
jgi:aminoglycoside phosphotransferase (APT) family kinase protein